MTSQNCRRRDAPFPLLLLLVLATLASDGCAGGYVVSRREGAGADHLAWFSPALAADRVRLNSWSAAVGPPVVRAAGHAASASPSDALRVVSWNTALGAGDVIELLQELRAADPDGPIVLLLQEVYRSGAEVPAALGPGTHVAGRLGSTTPSGTRDEIEAIAEAAGLSVYYVPSMRNGGPAVSDEDRGNAILSTLPLTAFTAIELPFERQRRVAVAATVSGTSSGGEPWQLRVVSTHLDNMVGARRVWFAGGEFARVRQARALLDHLQQEAAVVVGGDFNTWFGFEERTYFEMSKAFPDTVVRDRRPTFMRVLRLDHLFFRLPDGWTAEFARARRAYGSDHYPLIATVRLR